MSNNKYSKEAELRCAIWFAIIYWIDIKIIVAY